MLSKTDKMKILENVHRAEIVSRKFRECRQLKKWRMLQPLILLILYLRFSSCAPVTSSQPTYEDRDFWYSKARQTLNQRLKKASAVGDDVQKCAKNIVLLVGDGMSMSTLTAARIFKGQKEGQNGEDGSLAWELFPAVALAKTYNLDAQVGESSACATALMCGVKTNFETVGLDGRGKYENCYSSFTSRVDSLVDWAQREGKSTGIVTNTRITHATPAALYAHSASRYWEDDGKVPRVSRKSCKDIARQLVEDDPGRHINVLLGGGRRHWVSKVTTDPEDSTAEGRRLDGRNLIDDWLRDKKKRDVKAEYVWNRSQLHEVDAGKIDQLLGLFSYSHMDFELDRDKDADPSLTEMTLKALDIVRKNANGFFLFVEGGRIDHAHHFNNPRRALEETLVLESALLAILENVNTEDTIVVVTADHSHVMTLGALFAPKGNNIFGVDNRISDIDNMPYSTLLYANGPGYHSPRMVPTNVSIEEKNAVHGSAAPRKWATHGGEDVPVYATGPLSSVLFTGTIDQTYIPHAIAYSSCLFEYSNRNMSESRSNSTQVCTSADTTSVRAGNAAVVLASSVLGNKESKIPNSCCKLRALNYLSSSVPQFQILLLSYIYLTTT